MSGAASARRQRRALRATAVAALATAVIGVPGVAWARFTAPTTASLAVQTHTVGQPSQVTAMDCPGSGQADRYITVRWSAPADPLVTGYVVTLTTSDPSDQVPPAPVAGRQTTQITIDVPHKSAFTASVVSTLGNWQSAAVTAPGMATC